MTETPDEPIRLGDRYELGGLLGRGGMADVRVGRDLRLGRTVAVKQLRSDLASDPTFQERFRREAQSAASLNHPAIVAVYDTGEALGKDGHVAPYIVMEYVEGQTLRDVMRDGRKILPERALDITADVLSALDYSHRSGIVHRDIKPANVMLTPAGQIKVMDFGIARAIADASSAMTQTAAVIGTAQYLSPEQARGETVDARSDIYSTGCLLYELLTGRPPFVGDSPVSVAYQHVREEARPPSQLNPDVSASIDAIVAKALAKRTDDRYQSAAEMRTDIERLNAGHTIEAPAPTTQAMPAATTTIPAAVLPPPTGTLPATPADDDNGRKGTGRWWAWGLVALILLGGAIFAVTQMTKAPPPVMVTVPNVVGQDQDTAQRTLENKGFTIGKVDQQPSADVEKGLVSDQTPKAKESLVKGTAIDLIISTGPEAVSMPDVRQLQYKVAKQQLEGDEYKFKVIKKEVDDPAPEGQVLNSTPLAGQSVPVGGSVTLFVSKGQVAVPDLAGMTKDDALAALKNAKLKGTVKEDPASTEPADTVTAQSIPAGQTTAPGETITITVSTNPGTETPPTPTPPTPDVPSTDGIGG